MASLSRPGISNLLYFSGTRYQLGHFVILKPDSRGLLTFRALRTAICAEISIKGRCERLGMFKGDFRGYEEMALYNSADNFIGKSYYLDDKM